WGAESATEKRTPLCKAGFEVEGRGAHGDEVCPVRGYNYPTSHSQSVTHITTDGRTVLPLCRCPGAGGAYDSHHRTAGIAGRTRRPGRARCARRGAVGRGRWLVSGSVARGH